MSTKLIVTNNKKAILNNNTAYLIRFGSPMQDLKEECMTTNFCRISSGNTGDQGLCNGRYFQRTTTEPVFIISTIVEKKHIGYAFVSYLNQLSGTYNTNGQISTAIEYVLPSGRTVYVYRMMRAWGFSFITESSAVTDGNVKEFIHSELYYDSDDNEFYGDCKEQFMGYLETYLDLL